MEFVLDLLKFYIKSKTNLSSNRSSRFCRSQTRFKSAMINSLNWETLVLYIIKSFYNLEKIKFFFNEYVKKKWPYYRFFLIKFFL